LPDKLMLPGYYKTSKVMTNITGAQDAELTNFRAKLDSTANQFFVDTADFTLERWERELGIPVDNSKPVEYRRSVIRSKMRGVGTVKVSLINTVSESYTNGEVDVFEHAEGNYFTIKFVSVRGVPPNLDDLKRAIEDIKPAHLAVVYEFTYLIYDELKASGHTYDALLAHNLTYDQLKTWIPA